MLILDVDVCHGHGLAWSSTGFPSRREVLWYADFQTTVHQAFWGSTVW